MGYNSNYQSVSRALQDFEQAFNLRRTRKSGRRIGDELATAAAQTIQERTIAKQEDPDGLPLAKLKPATIKRKIRKNALLLIGVETHEMLRLSELVGQVHVTDDTVRMRYGLSPDTRERAEIFTEGREGVQAPRPFYELGEDGETEIEDLLDDVVDEAIEEFEQSP